ncbi:MAG: hypothetical protein JSV19_06190 [Phycisphaerales bacterium]|nr:MAG: hypothetical protein JSV19_06190 [Phycisphaerales bacterium]
MRFSQIVAVDHVALEASPGAAPDLVWLYSEVVGLGLIDEGPSEGRAGGSPRIRFRSGDIELRYALVSDPVLEPVACRLTVEVPSLATVEESLSGRAIRVERIRGLRYTDRRLCLLDPGGNRITIRQQWPAWF